MVNKKIHTSKDQAIIIVDALAYLIRNWKSILLVWGAISTFVITLSTFTMNKVLIPSVKPLVRPTIKEYTKHYQSQIDSIKLEIKDVRQDVTLFCKPD